jgi:lysophospholipase L1-like esterase
MKRLSFALAAVTIALTATLAIAELALQIADFPKSDFSPWVRMHDTGYGYAPSLHRRMTRPGEYDVAFDTNALGLRDEEVGAKQGKRVLLLGDSFATGYGIEREQTFADLLEKRLGAEIVNAAVGGYEIVHQTRYFAGRGLSLEPDLVVYALYLGNDLSRNDEWLVAKDGALISPKKDFPLRVAHEIKLRVLAKQLGYRLKMSAERGRGEWEPHADYLLTAERTLSAPARADYGRAEELLRVLRDEVRESGARFFIVLIPYRTMVDPAALAALRERIPDLDGRFDFSLPGRRTAEILDRLGIEHMDVSPALAAHFAGGGEPLYFPVDGHLNARGNEVVAAAIEPVLRTRIAALP